MSSVGDMLREERQRRGLSLDQISRETKIPPRLLEAIENNHFELLPGGVFAKSFVRQYARFLSLDDDALTSQLAKLVSSDIDLANVAPEPAYKVPRMDEWNTSRGPGSSILPALAMMVAMVLICSGLYVWWQRSRAASAAARPPSSTHSAQQTVRRPAEQPVTPAATPSQAAAPVTGQSAAQPQEETASKPGEPANPAATLEVSLTADADDWVRVTSDGKVLMSDTMHPSEVKTFAADEALQLRVGDAGNLQLTVNGKPAGPLGPKGQVRNVEVTRDGVHILAPPPKPAPAPALEPL